MVIPRCQPPIWVIIATAVASLGCSERFTVCADCLPTTGGTESTGAIDGGGSGGLGGQSTGGAHSSGGTNSGGTTAGGASNSGDTGGTKPDPCDACTGDTPVCVDEECVACTEEDAGSCGDTELCTPKHECVPCLGEATPGCAVGEVCADENECVGCTESAHCTDAAASLCTDEDECAPCVENDDCAHIEGKNVCDVGECVECTTADDCGGNVCDPRTHQCTELPAATEFACEPCSYDAQCSPGHVCVEMTYSNPTEGVVGSFCLWLKDATELGAPSGTCGLNSQPYADRATVTTVDGVEATVCKPRTTTCPALLQHAKTITGCEIPGDDDNACGAPAFNDGRCRHDSSDTPLCTYPCLDNKDCKAGSTCPEVGDQVCSL